MLARERPRFPAAARHASLLFLAVVLAVHALVSPWEWNTRAAAVVETLVEGSRGWLTPTLLAGWLSLIVAGVVICAVGRHPLRDLGLQANGARTGLLALVGGAAVGIALLVAFGDMPSPARLAREFITHVAGVALVEEVLYRGFLLRQIWAYLEPRIGASTRALALAVAVDAIAFALMHPLAGGWPVAGASFAEHAISGAVYALLYVRRGSLWIVIALHGTGNVAVSVASTDAARFACDATFLALALVIAVWAPAQGSSAKQ